jgi:alpha-1,6-mannosyltransferase
MFYAAEGGGVRTYLAAKSDWLRRHSSIRHTVVAPALARGYADMPLVSVPSVSIGSVNGYRLPRSIRASAATLCSLQPDLIEVGDPYQFAWAALRVRRSRNIPLVAFYHSDLPQVVGRRFGRFAGRAARRYCAQLYRQFDLVLAPSQLMTRQLQALGIHQARVQPLGVDSRIYTPACRDPQLRSRLGLAADARLLVYAGRFTREKRLPLLIDAVQKLGPPYHLLLIGGARLNLPACVTQLPYQHCPQALARLMASCDALVHPGDQETFGLVVLEAMACGLPVIGVQAGGVAELVDTSTGFLVRPASAAALAEGISALYDCDRDWLGENARRKVLTSYDWRIVFPQLIEHYARLCDVDARPTDRLVLATE